MEFYFLLFLAGLAGGLFSGLLGVGGGLVYILILPAAFIHIGIPVQEIAQYTVANSILGTFFAASFGTVNHIGNKEFYPKAILIISLSAIIASLLTLNFIVNTPFYSKEVFNIVVIILLVIMLLSTLRNAQRQKFFVERIRFIKRFFGFTGVSAGTVAALTGLGGGIIIIPFLSEGLRMEIRKAKTISLGVISITSLSMVLFNMFQQPMFPLDIPHTGYIVFQVSIPIIIGTLISATFGVKLSRRISVSTISYLFSTFVLIVILKKLFELI
ncbi:sulfite exporter TauE/SafE family protein [Marivirga sp. S37H4]|uniref:Probable membrane transporter protein n=1 Tax=Marivirga aurantiaca TaxID=2802615 RepID=A0A934X1N0_9BACT|nr:sulfite exporter TauE/SafE family protein [Marivirga aurantiaca]MBK6266671.1 sulfite exporter TauE/SafE family protein [Marivirga aurantiaca]